MKVFNLQCARDHRFEGWFSSAADFDAQAAQRQIQCPLCDSTEIRKMPSAPRLNLAREEAVRPQAGDDIQAQWLALARKVIEHTEDVGTRFAEEARRIHYDEAPVRGIRGVVSAEEGRALVEEGIDILPLPLPAALKQPLQ